MKRALGSGAPRVVAPHLVMNATAADVDDHTQKLRDLWSYLRQHAPELEPYCSVRDTYTGCLSKSVVGSKSYW